MLESVAFVGSTVSSCLISPQYLVSRSFAHREHRDFRRVVPIWKRIGTSQCKDMETVGAEYGDLIDPVVFVARLKIFLPYPSILGLPLA